MYEGSVCVWDVDMVAVHASGMSVFVLGFEWCHINEAIADTSEPADSAHTASTMHSAYEV